MSGRYHRLRCHRQTETSRPIHTHANARLTQRGRLRLVTQHLHKNRSLPELAAEAGISLRCAYKWLARFRSGGAASLADRRSVRRTQRR
ncbi:leucine zipper domain-containing protein [Synechococcus sp. HJ21-Hayes]|uniref:leucine zipper domain-containing protein n=1 Tax=Synechococcus sp. HJ21-Hayes TaxID=2823736 RepID=UPI0020CC9FFB|nr:leucine zipper domain-containing protein [Synechococcus sp. HJ21-Hayes]